MSAEVRAIELVDETYEPGNHPACWSHRTLKRFACRKVNFLYEACGCSSFLYMHSLVCTEGGDPDHEINGDEKATFPSEDFWVAIDEERCGSCTDLQIITTIDSRSEPPSFLRLCFNKKAEKTPKTMTWTATVTWNQKRVCKPIPNPRKAETSPEKIMKRKNFYEDNIRNQQCERCRKGKRFLGLCDEEWERDLIFEPYSPVMLFPDNAWFEGMKQKLVAAVSQNNPSGSRNPEPKFKY